jgi:lipopolysaccharide transport system permease protein
MPSATLIVHESRSVAYYLQPQRIPQTFWRHRQLVGQLIRRAVAGRYRGSSLGMLWSFILPLVMLAVYTFVFSVVLEARWPQTPAAPPAPAENSPAPGSVPATMAGTPPAAAPEAPPPGPPAATRPPPVSRTDFALILFCGLVLFNLFAECVGAAPGTVVGNVSYVKKVVFPLEILPVVALGAAIFNALVNFGILLVGILVFRRTLPVTAGYFPLVALPLVIFTLGLSWFLLQMLLFLTPIFYPIAIVSAPAFQFVMRLNPLSVIVENSRRTLLFGRPPEWGWLLAAGAMSLVLMQLGYVWFMKTKRGFADVL